MKEREGGRQIRKESKRKLYGKEIDQKIKNGENGDRNESRTVKTKKEGRKEEGHKQRNIISTKIN
jgi:hypothetical protein